MTAFEAAHGPIVVRETITGDELAFARDSQAASDAELDLTVSILRNQRARCLDLLAELPGEALDWDNPGRVLPRWAKWRTIRQTMWHIADTESRNYLPAVGLAEKPRERELRAELETSHDHVLMSIIRLPPELVVHLKSVNPAQEPVHDIPDGATIIE